MKETHMRKALLAVAMTGLVTLVGCHRNTREEVKDDAEDAAETAGDKTEDAAETAGDKVEDATDD
jgi:hypothetical protein